MLLLKKKFYFLGIRKVFKIDGRMSSLTTMPLFVCNNFHTYNYLMVQACSPGNTSTI